MEGEVDRCLSIGVPGVRNAAVNGYRVIRVSSKDIARKNESQHRGLHGAVHDLSLPIEAEVSI